MIAIIGAVVLCAVGAVIRIICTAIVDVFYD